MGMIFVCSFPDFQDVKALQGMFANKMFASVNAALRIPLTNTKPFKSNEVCCKACVICITACVMMNAFDEAKTHECGYSIS